MSYTFTPGLSSAPLGPRQQELLSWFQGIAPVGQPFAFHPLHAASDLGMSCRELVYRSLWRLMVKGYVAKVSDGNRGDKGVLVVLRRLEA